MPFSIRLAEPELTFTALHGIRYESGELEPLHEHNFRVIAEIAGAVNSTGYVVDFLAASEELKKILRSLCGKTLLAQNEDNTRGIICPNAYFLPVGNTTAELIAEYIAKQFESQLKKRAVWNNHTVKIELEESPGCWAIYTVNGHK